jgi:hypothetical protein
MKGPDFERLSEMGLRRDPRPLELAEWQALISKHPDLEKDIEAELLLNQALRRLPQVPVSSNFTHLVLQAVREDQTKPAAWSVLRCWNGWGRLGWVRPAALAGLVLCVSGLVYQQHQRYVRREMAQSLVAVSRLMPESTPAVVSDFDVFHRMILASQNPANALVANTSMAADLTLLKVLQLQ